MRDLESLCRASFATYFILRCCFASIRLPLSDDIAREMELSKYYS